MRRAACAIAVKYFLGKQQFFRRRLLCRACIVTQRRAVCHVKVLRRRNVGHLHGFYRLFCRRIKYAHRAVVSRFGTGFLNGGNRRRNGLRTIVICDRRLFAFCFASKRQSAGCVSVEKVADHKHRFGKQRRVHYQCAGKVKHRLQRICNAAENHAAESRHRVIVIVNVTDILRKTVMRQKGCRKRVDKQHHGDKQHYEVSKVFAGNAYALAGKGETAKHDYGSHDSVKSHAETSHKEVGNVFHKGIEISSAKGKYNQHRGKRYADDAPCFCFCRNVCFHLLNLRFPDGKPDGETHSKVNCRLYYYTILFQLNQHFKTKENCIFFTIADKPRPLYNWQPH